MAYFDLNQTNFTGNTPSGMSYTDAQAGLNSWSNNYNKPFFSPEQQQNYTQGLNNWNSNPNIGQDLIPYIYMYRSMCRVRCILRTINCVVTSTLFLLYTN